MTGREAIFENRYVLNLCSAINRITSFIVLKILILQTAFIGDVVLASPLIDAVKKEYPYAEVSLLTIPYSAPALKNHPGLKEIIVFDKRGKGGFCNTLKMVKRLKNDNFNLALVPHRSFRSAAIVWAAGIPQRIGFDRSAGRLLFTDVIEYRKDWHEVKRNLSLLGMEKENIAPKIYPGEAEEAKASQLLERFGVKNGFIAIAPGSVWDTKRWPEVYFQELCGSMRKRGFPQVILVGAANERELCERIAAGMEGYGFIAAGELNPLESGALLERAAVLVTNDSAAGHIAAAVGTNVMSIFGPTAPDFGFAPYGEGHIIVEHPDLYCRPCRIHGSRRCPEQHFRCMKELRPETVIKVLESMF